MSVQFRTSQQDLITVSNKTLSKEIGVCCKFDVDQGTIKQFSTPLDCYLQNGTFFYAESLESVNCFDIASTSGADGASVLGCCCACSIAMNDDNYESLVAQMMPVDSYCDNPNAQLPSAYRNTFGLKKISQCECERIGGKWTAGECPSTFDTDAQVRQYCFKRMQLSEAPPVDDGTDDVPCGNNDADQGEGGTGVTYNYINLSSYGSGEIIVRYNMFGIPDRMDILYPAPYGGATFSDAIVAATTDGLVSGSGSISFSYTPEFGEQAPPSGYTASYTTFIIKITGNPNTNTAWNYAVSCPQAGDGGFPNLPGPGISCDIDLRLPRSCCYFNYDINGFPVGISCENVCNPRECELKSISTSVSVYSEGTVCSPNILSTQITSTPYSCGSVASIMATNSNLFRDIPYGSCYTLVDNGQQGYSYECNIAAEFFCYDGYWVKNYNETDLCFNNKYAPQTPIKSLRKVEPEKMLESDFLNLKIRIGQFYKGGYYIGTFQPGSPITPSGSTVYGSTEFSYPKNINSNANGNGEKYKKWALFVEPNQYNISLFESGETDNTNYSLLSMYDGFYNCYGNIENFGGLKNKTTNTIVGKNRKGFVDFYIPSIYELMFLTNQMLKIQYLADLFKTDGIYMTSSSYNNFIYTQYLSTNPIYNIDETLTTNYGRVLLAQPTSFLNCKFFRKIILT